MRDEGEAIAPRDGSTWRITALVVMALLGVVVLVALIVTLGGANRQRDQALQLQTHSFDVMILARTLDGMIARSEASLGRYVISGDKRLGRLYYDEWLQAGSGIDQLDRMSRTSTGSRPRIQRLRAAYDLRGKELSLIALSTNYGKNGQALARYYQARDASSLATINQVLDQIIARQRQRLAERTAAAAASVDRSSHIAGVLAVFGSLIVLGAILLGWFTIRALTDRAVAQADADAERKRAEELTAAVEAATGALRVQEAKLRQIQKMEAVGQLTGGIAHDFNNMLAVVLGGLELARRSLKGEATAAHRHIDSASEGANRAVALTRRLLAFSREESLKHEPLVAATLVAGMTDLLDRTLGDAIELVTEDRSDGWRVCADRIQLENAILNLAVNARDAMNGRGTLTIVTGHTALASHAVGQCVAGEYVTIAVGDSGCGMTPDIAERVFEPFFTTKPVGKGTGLGLSQIFALVRQLDGEIGIATAPDQGTTVTLYLPRELSETLADAVAEPAAPATAPRAVDILVVEDDPRVLAATIGALEELGHRVVACDDPLTAPALLDAHRIDIILTDVLMPRQTGPEMIAALPDRFARMPVIFVTGFAGDTEASGVGDHQVLRKPFTLQALEAAIDAVAPHRDTEISIDIAAE
ncbi:ATP-binding protein [Sphingomonas bacterium]|uniref:ATP-binding protein n=1 Tax=Sphingomonas bacterium TaxID=1895847 RepID=UPI0015761A67|nr:ATP-binding protein [Sphingomonas bacterium]